MAVAVNAGLLKQRDIFRLDDRHLKDPETCSCLAGSSLCLCSPSVQLGIVLDELPSKPQRLSGDLLPEFGAARFHLQQGQST